MTVVVLLLAASALVLASVLALRILGGREPVYRIADGKPAFFVALKYRDGMSARPEKPAAGVEVKWASRADFAFVGSDEAYWDRFLILAGGAPDAMPLAPADDVEDAYVARLALGRPPRPVLGIIRLLVAARIWRKPRGEVSTDLGHRGFRAEVMPTAASISRLLAMPPAYKPAMVNFLKYYPAARYADPRAGAKPSTGRAAYGRYGIVAMQTVYRTGGHLVFYGKVETVIREAQGGPTLGRWDDLAVMQYSEPRGILTMEQVPRYVAALRHRDAALDRSIVIATTPES